jgi:putative ABC transport system permease protein
MAVPIVRRNLVHERGKFILSVSGISASLALMMLLLGFREGLYATLTAYVDNLGADLIIVQSGVKGMFSSDSILPIGIHDEAVLASGAVEAGHILVADVIFTHGDVKTPILLVGYQPGELFGKPWKLSRGRLLENDGEVLLDTWLAHRSRVGIGDSVELLGKSFRVVGLTRGTSSWMSPYTFITLDAATTTLGLTSMVSNHLLRLPEGADASKTADAIEASIAGVEALTPMEIAQADQRVIATVMDTPIIVILFIGTVIGIAVMGLTAYTAAIDQMREYGVLKAVGASNGWLTRLVATETLYRAILGYILGIGLAYLAAWAIMRAWPQFNILYRLESIGLVGVLSLIMTLIAALLPIGRLKKVDPMVVFKA